MNAIQPAERPTKSRGSSIWTYLIICLVLAVVGMAALGYALYHSNSDRIRLAGQLEAQQNATKRLELAAQKAAEQDQLTLARNQQAQLLAQVSAATNSLLQLLAGSDQARAEAAALRTNAAGRAVALHPDLVRLAGRLFESGVPEIPPEPDITTRLEAVRRIGQQVCDARGTAYAPAAALGVTVQNATIWAEQGLLKLGQVRDALSGLVRESKIKFTRATLTADSPTLGAAIAKQNEEVAGGQLRQAEQTVSAARTNAVLTRAEADAAGALARAEADAQKVRAEADRYAEESRRKLAEEKAAQEQEWQQREASLKLAASQTKVAVQNTVDAARKVELKKKASDTALQAKLAPFITPGYKGVFKESYDPQPLSYSELQSAGALAPTVEGLDKLVFIGTNLGDRVRPRWKINRVLYHKHNDQLAMVKEVQQLLIELGPVLVEMNLLTP